MWDSRSHSTLGGCDMVRARPAVSEPEPRSNGKKRAGRFRRDGPKRVFQETTTRGRPTRHSPRARHAPIRPFHASRATFVAVYRPRRARARSGVRPRGGDSQRRPVESTVILEGVVVRDFRSRVATRLLPRLHRGHRPRCASASIPFHARVARETFASTSQPARRAGNARPPPKTGVSILRSDVPRRRARGRPGTLLTSHPHL